MEVETIKRIVFHGKPKGGWSSLDKLKKLVKKEWDLELEDPMDASEQKMWIETDIEFGTSSITRFMELIEEAEKYGKKANSEYAKKEKITDAQRERLEKEHPDLDVVWSMGTELLDDVAVEGEVIFRHGKRSRKATNPTWMEVALICDDIAAKGDHIFLEGIHEVRKGVKKQKDRTKEATTVAEYEFCMGS